MTSERSRLLPLLALVAAAPACGSGDGLPAVSGPTAADLEVTAYEMRFDPPRIAVPRGNVPVVLRNGGSVIHDLRIDGQPALLVEAPPGQTATATWPLGKGRYRLYCSVPGHRAGGMEGVVEVR